MLALNMVAIVYSSMSAIPFGTMVVILLLWLIISAPLTIAGTIVGRTFAGRANYPCRVNAIPRLVPDKAWFASPAVLSLLGGVLPFGSIFIEVRGLEQGGAEGWGLGRGGVWRACAPT